MAQVVKHLPIMRETRVQSLGWEDLLEKEMAPHSRTLAWKIPLMEEPTGVTKSRTQLSDFTFTEHSLKTPHNLGFATVFLKALQEGSLASRPN